MSLVENLHKRAAEVMWDPATQQTSTQPTKPSAQQAQQAVQAQSGAAPGMAPAMPDMMDMENARLEKMLANAKLRLEIIQTEQQITEAKAGKPAAKSDAGAKPKPKAEGEEQKPKPKEKPSATTKNPATQGATKALAEKAGAGKPDGPVKPKAPASKEKV